MSILEKLKIIANTNDSSDNFKKMVDSDNSEEIPDELPSLPKMRSSKIEKTIPSVEKVKHAAMIDHEEQSHSEQFDDLLELDNFVTKKRKVEAKKVNIRNRAEEVAVLDDTEEVLIDTGETISDEVGNVEDDKSLYFKTLAVKINDDENHEKLVEELSSRPQDFMSKIAESWKQDKHDDFSRKLKKDINNILGPLQVLEQEWRKLNLKQEDLNSKIDNVELEIEEKTIELNKLLKQKLNHIRSDSILKSKSKSSKKTVSTHKRKTVKKPSKSK